MAEEIITSSGFTVSVRKLSVWTHLELKTNHNLSTDYQFQRKVLNIAGDMIELPYTPPKELPDSQEEMAVFIEYLNWLKGYQQRLADYSQDRNNAILGSCIKIKSGPEGMDWEAYYKSEEWAEELKVARINYKHALWIAFIKTAVLPTESDMIQVLQASLIEEVTMADVVIAFDYFRHTLERCTAITANADFARIRRIISDVIIGSEDGGSLKL